MILPVQPYHFEREMLEPLVTALPSILGLGLAQRGVRTVCVETTIGNVVPDVLFGIWRQEPAPRRRPLHMIERHALAAIEHAQELDADELACALHLTRNEAVACLQRLSRTAIVDEVSPGKFSLGATDEAGLLEIVAVEAKMRRWREALAQAHVYRCFADRVFVSLDGNQVSAKPHMIEAFHHAGVGLLLQHQFVVHEVVPAVHLRPRTPGRVQASDKLRAGKRLPST